MARLSARFSPRFLLRQPVIREWLLMTLLLSGLALVALDRGWLWRVDQTLYDAALTLYERPAQNDIVIVGIDQASLDQLGRWPWQRTVHADLLNRLTVAGARAVGLDLVLSEPDVRNPASDQLLAKAIAENGRVVLPVSYEVTADRAQLVLPFADYAAAARQLAHVSGELDPDGILRATYLQAGVGAEQFPQFALAMLMVADPEVARWIKGAGTPGHSVLPGEHNPIDNSSSPFWTTNYWFHIPYIGTPGKFNTVSYASVLRGEVSDAVFKDKLVLIGMTANSMGDAYPTPVSGLHRAMPGIEIHANLIQALQEKIDLRRASTELAMVLSLLLVIGLMLSYLWLSPRLALAFTILLGLALILSAGLLFRYGQLWISPTVAIAAMLLAYPLWSWRKLEATQRYLDDELHRLALEPSLVPEERTPLRPGASAEQSAFVPDLISRKIDALRLATARLRNLRRFVSDTLESLPEAAVVADRAGQLMLMNSGAVSLFGSSHHHIDALLTTMQHAEGQSWRSLLDQVLATGHTVAAEARHENEREYLVQMAASYSAEGQQTGAIITFIDISPLRESERRRDEALRFLSHDMRSPQASILTLLDLHQESPDTMPVAKLTDRIGKYARRTLNLADDFLRLARAERVRPQDFSGLDLRELLLDAVEEAWTLATAKGIRIVLEDQLGDDEGAWVNGDRDMLTRAIMNLLSNAIKYSPQDTQVICRLKRLADHWQIEIADQGYGITPEDLPKLFGRFARLRHDAQPEEDGIGLGLVFVKTVLARHGGDISVQSVVAQPPGESHGTTFTIVLPALA